MKKYSIAVTEGDGIGPEITAEAAKVLRRAGELGGFSLEFVPAPAGGRTYEESGEALPEGTLRKYMECDAVLKAPVGSDDPKGAIAVGRDMVVACRQELGLYVNLRPVKLFSCLRDVSPLKDSAIGKGIDLVIVRENSEGLYCLRGREGEDGAMDESVYTKKAVDRIIEYAFQYAEGNGRRKVTSVDKANLLYTSKFWRARFAEISAGHPQVKSESAYIDAMCQYLVRSPHAFDVIVTENAFGDILSDEAAQLVGSLGLCGGANLNPETKKGIFEPVHGSAPDIAGRGIANPISMILSAGMMLDFLGEKEASRNVRAAVEMTLESGLRTKDICNGKEDCAGTSKFGDAVEGNLRQAWGMGK